ncbi:DUF937 domain-containing protein [uncultured Arcticibacterium sp.]|uniref:DUF937 domain-containing protein n=1 Tax=uncultured Arcticibacterium sp. TaxID=2173042 RepID=UPI0030F64F71
MEIINGLKSKIGVAEIEKISNFLGESAEAVSKSLDLSLNAMLGGLKGVSTNDGNAAKILKVINDGGHSGDLTDDLPRLFNNPDKVQLLITIGKNINNHFFNSKAGVLIDKIAEIGALSKTSASSLFSLSAPLILGVLGKSIKTEGLNLDGFTAKLSNAGLSTEAGTSAVLLGSLGFSGTSSVPPKEIYVPTPEISKPAPAIAPAPVVKEPSQTVNKQKSKKEGNSEGSINWLAWVFLAILGLAAMFYTFRGKYQGTPKTADEISSKDSSFYESEKKMFENLETDRNKMATIGSTGNTGLNDLSVKEGANAASNADLKTDADEDFDSPAFSNNKVVSEKTAPKTETPVRSAPEPARNTSPSQNKQPTVTPERATSDTRPMSVKLGESNSFSGINGLSFKSNSAEIRSKGALNDVVSYLKSNPAKSIQIAGTGSSVRVAEDRAYGLQGALYEAGISTSRIQVLSNPVQGDGPVVVKVK